VDGCKPLGAGEGRVGLLLPGGGAIRQGMAVQVDPTTTKLKPPGTMSLKLRHDEPLSNIAFNFNLRRYTKWRTTLWNDIDTTAMEAGAHTRHFAAQPQPYWSHLPVSPCVIDWGEIMRPTYLTKCAYVEPKSGGV
jgi:hypothetical protein